MAKLNAYKNTLNLCEAGQTIETRMAYVHKEKNGTYTQLHDTVKCRDYLGDVLFAEEQKRTVTIYGFSWNGNKQKIDKSRTRLMIDFRGKLDMMHQFIENLEIFNRIERQHKLIKSFVEVVDNRDTTLILTGSSFWLKSVFTISLYSFLIKVCCYKFKDNKNWLEEMKAFGGVDSGYVKQTQQVLQFYIDNLKKIVYKLPSVIGLTAVAAKNTETNQVHNYSGFVSKRFFISNGLAPDDYIGTRLAKLWKKEQQKNGKS